MIISVLQLTWPLVLTFTSTTAFSLGNRWSGGRVSVDGSGVAPFRQSLYAQPQGDANHLISSSPTIDSTTTRAQQRLQTTTPVQPPPLFVTQVFFTECDDTNRPPSLQLLLHSLQQLITSGGSDVRGRFVDHPRLGTAAAAAHAIARVPSLEVPPLTPLAAYCLGHGLATYLIEERLKQKQDNHDSSLDDISIVIGQDPRPHGMRLADSLARGALSVNDSNSNIYNNQQPRVRVYYTGLATTPACAFFAQPSAARLADAAVMVTASHLPVDRNGLKVFLGHGRTTTALELQRIGVVALDCASQCYTAGTLPPSSGDQAVHCTAHVNYMPYYEQHLANAFAKLIRGDAAIDSDKDNAQLLRGLTLVLNPGHGSGGFFQSILERLGANVAGSIHVEPDGSFPVGVPNPESNLESDTIKACQACGADLGIMLDTDSDRCGFVVPKQLQPGEYEPLHRNKLIALLGVVFARTDPGCAVVTDSVTSEGLTTFLKDLGLQHVRYLKGYANVINKARALTESGQAFAPLAIETSGHCAMEENGYLDDGTYTAVKVISLLATERQSQGDASCSISPLLDLINDLEEVAEIKELRMKTVDGSLETMQHLFDILSLQVEMATEHMEDWSIDTENLEGLRIRTGDSQFFMLRKSLHDPVISLQIESRSVKHVRTRVVQPLLEILQENPTLGERLDASALQNYSTGTTP